MRGSRSERSGLVSRIMSREKRDGMNKKQLNALRKELRNCSLSELHARIASMASYDIYCP